MNTWEADGYPPGTTTENLTVAQIWMFFSKLTFGDRPVSEVQYLETRKTFYTTFSHAIIILGEISELGEEHGAHKIQSFLKEILAFMNKEQERFKQEGGG